MEDFLEVGVRAARLGGDVLLEWSNRFQVMSKGPGDLVTEADHESQRVIREILLGEFPHHYFRGEENISGTDDSREEAVPDGAYQWVVDPLDGTTNYVHGLPFFAVSIALVQRSEPLIGVVYEPISGRMFQAIRGNGAFLNGVRLRVSSCTQLSDGLIGASLPPFVREDSADLRRFIEVVGSCQAIRRLGSAALNLSYVAAGWLDGYYSESVKPWDVAAGILLVLEAGGKLTSLGGSDFSLERPNFICAATASLHAELSARLARVE